MAFPVLVGIPLLISALLKIGGYLFDFFIRYFARGIAVNLAWLVLIVGLYLGLAASIQAILSGIHFVSPPFIAKAMGMFLPEELPLIIGAYFGLHFVSFVFHLQVRLSTHTKIGKAGDMELL